MSLGAVARTWVGVPFRHAGRSRAGVDCLGLAIAVAREAGIAAPDADGYPRRPSPRALAEGLRAHMDRAPAGEAPRDGDLLVFAEPHPVHVGVVEVDGAGRRWVIHAYAPARKVIREPLEGERLRRVVAAYRHRG